MVIGLTIFEGGAVGAAYLAAVFISNLPEAISSTSGLVTSGWKKSRILWMWIAIAVVSALASLAGYGPLPGLLTGHRRLRARLRGRRDPHHARGHDDARGVRARRQAGRDRDDARIRGRLRDPLARIERPEAGRDQPALHHRCHTNRGSSDGSNRRVARATTPRGAAVVIATASIVVTIARRRPDDVADHERFPSIGSGLWWAVQTTTTVGYGDNVPENIAGRLVAAVRDAVRDRLPDGHHRRDHEHVRRPLPPRAAALSSGPSTAEQLRSSTSNSGSSTSGSNGSKPP